MSGADLKEAQKQKKNKLGKEMVIWDRYFGNKLTEGG